MKRLAAITVILLVTGVAMAQEAAEEPGEGVGLTIYSKDRENQQPVYDNGRYVTPVSGYATVRECRLMELTEGAGAVRFADVAAQIKPDTVHFVSLTDPEGTFVLEQNYEYDLISSDKIMEKYIDREINIVCEDEKGNIETETVTLLAAARYQGYVVKRADPQNPIEILNGLPRVRLGAIPGGLITRPTLVWNVRCRKGGRHLCKVTYETDGIAWESCYTAVLKKGDAATDLSGWVTIENSSGATYENAAIKLVAGDVRGRASGRSSTGATGGGRGAMRSRQITTEFPKNLATVSSVTPLAAN